jgi:hypothetical protein
VNKGITSNWRWWQPSLDEMKVGRHSLTLHAMKEAADDADAKVKGELIAEFIFYAVDPPNRGALRVLTVMPPPSHFVFCREHHQASTDGDGQILRMFRQKGFRRPSASHWLDVCQARFGAVADAAVGQEGLVFKG